MSEDSIAINPDDLNKRPERKATKNKKDDKITAEDRKFSNKGGKVTINFESNGRFGNPATVIMSDYSVDHVTDITTADADDLYETLISILNELQHQEEEINMGELTQEEFIEVLIGMKAKFQSIHHTHLWLCKCQRKLEEDQQQVNETEVNLAELNYKSITEVDKEYRVGYKTMIDDMTDDEYTKFLHERYKDDPIDIESWTKEKEVESAHVKEPFIYVHPDTNERFEFRLGRVGDIIEAQNLAKDKYKTEIYAIRNRKNAPGERLAESKMKKEEELKKLKLKQAKEASTIAASLSLIGYNGRQLTDPYEKVEIYRKLVRSNLFEISDFLGSIDFGLNNEIELECPHCGEVERRWLQQAITPIELVPFDTSAKGDKRKHVKSNIYFGV